MPPPIPGEPSIGLGHDRPVAPGPRWGHERLARTAGHGRTRSAEVDSLRGFVRTFAAHAWSYGRHRAATTPCVGCTWAPGPERTGCTEGEAPTAFSLGATTHRSVSMLCRGDFTNDYRRTNPMSSWAARFAPNLSLAWSRGRRCWECLAATDGPAGPVATSAAGATWTARAARSTRSARST